MEGQTGPEGQAIGAEGPAHLGKPPLPWSALSQYGRMGLVLVRRIFRGLTIAVLSAARPEPHTTCGGPARIRSDVISIAPADVRLWVSLDVHKFSIVAATLPPAGGKPEVCRIETTEKAIRRVIDRLGGPEGLAVC